MNKLNIITKLSDCTEILTGKNIDKSKTNEQGNGTPYITGASDIVKGQIQCRRFVVEEQIKNPTIAIKGDIIISTVGTLGKIGMMTIDRAVLSGHCAIIRPKKGVSLPYLTAIVSRLVLDICPDDEFLSGFSKKLDIEQLKDLKLSLPKLIIQDYIVTMMAQILSLTVALEASKDTMEDHAQLIDLLAEEYNRLRVNYKSKIKLLEDLDSHLNHIEDKELKDILNHFNDIKNRLKNI